MYAFFIFNVNAFNICNYYSNPDWNTLFGFNVYVADEAIIDINAIRNRNVNNTSIGQHFIVQNPIVDQLYIKDISAKKNDPWVLFKLIDLQGNLILLHESNDFFEQISIPIQGIPSGIYLLKIQMKHMNYSTKVAIFN